MINEAAKSIKNIEKALEACRLGHPLFSFETLASTNDELKKMARNGAPEGTVIWAEEQTAGRGRIGKSWLSKKGLGLYVSILFRPSWTFGEASFFPILASLSVAKMLENFRIKNIKIKWPNDIEIDGKKVAGVLVENCYKEGKLLFCIMGIGVNVLHKKIDFEGMEYNKQPTSLLIEGVKASVDDVLVKLLQILDALYSKALHNGIEAIIEEYAGYLSTS